MENIKSDNILTRLRLSATIRKLCVLVFVPIAGVGYAHWRFPTWFVTPPAKVDPWIYWGSAENLEYVKKNFSDTYYFRRWTLTLPNYLFQHVFSPLHAQFVLRSLLLLGVLLAIAVAVWIATKSVVIVALTSFTLCSNEYMIHLVGESYNEGTGVLLVSAGVGLIVWSINQRLRRQAFLYGAAGFLFGLAMISYQFTAYIFPPIFLVAALHRFELSWMHSLRRQFFLAVYAIGGFTSALMMDLYVGRLLGTPWGNLLTYSLRVGNGLRSQNSYSVTRDVFLYQVVLDPGSYLVPIGALLIAYPLMPKDARSRSTAQTQALIRYAGLVFLIFLTLPMLPKMTNIVSYPNTNVYLLLSLYLTFAVVVHRLFEYALRSPNPRPLRQEHFGLVVIASLVSAVVVSALFRSKGTTTAFYWTAIAIPIGAAVTRWVIPKFKQGAGWPRVLLAVGLIAASLGVMETTELRWAPAQRSTFDSRAAAGRFMQDLSDSTRRLTDIANKESRRIWLIDSRKHAGWSTNISALYGLYSAATVGFPPPPVDCNQLNWIVMFSNSSIVVVGKTGKERAESLVRGLIKDCSSVDLRFRLVDLESRSVWFDVAQPATG